MIPQLYRHAAANITGTIAATGTTLYTVYSSKNRSIFDRACYGRTFVYFFFWFLHYHRTSIFMKKGLLCTVVVPAACFVVNDATAYRTLCKEGGMLAQARVQLIF